MATENLTWDYTRIQRALKNVGHRVGQSTIARVLKAHGLPPGPQRPTSRQTFLHAHCGVIAGAGFFTAEVWTRRGLGDLLHRNRHRPRVPACADPRMEPCPDRICVVFAPCQAPNANAYAQRFVRSIKDETPLPADPAGRVAPPARHQGICRALSLGTESPSTRQSTDRAAADASHGGTPATAPAAGRAAQFLRAGGVLGRFGGAVEHPSSRMIDLEDVAFSYGSMPVSRVCEPSGKTHRPLQLLLWPDG